MFFEIFDFGLCFLSYFNCPSVFLVAKMYKKLVEIAFLVRCNVNLYIPSTIFF